MSLRSPLGRVLGYGTAKDGVGHWWVQRLTAVALVPLMLWFVYWLVTFESFDYLYVVDWLAEPLNAVLMMFLVLALAYHSKLGVQVVVEDYVHHHGLKVVILVLVDFAHILAAGVALFAILKVAFGGTA